MDTAKRSKKSGGRKGPRSTSVQFVLPLDQPPKMPPKVPKEPARDWSGPVNYTHGAPSDYDD